VIVGVKKEKRITTGNRYRNLDRQNGGKHAERKKHEVVPPETPSFTQIRLLENADAKEDFAPWGEGEKKKMPHERKGHHKYFCGGTVVGWKSPK